MTQLKETYLAYLDCLNRQAWSELADYVDQEVEHNGRPLHLAGYRDMLIADFAAIPDLRFEPELLVCEPLRLAARLKFDCSPKATFMGLAVNRRRVTFHEHVFYDFQGAKIARVWSVIDKAAIEAQLP